MAAGAYNYKIDGGRIIAPKTYDSSDFRLVLVEGDAYGSIELDSVINSSKTASIVNYFGTSGNNTLAIKGTCEAARLLTANFATPTAKTTVVECRGDFSEQIINILGDDGEYNVTEMNSITTGVNAVVTAAPIRFHGSNKLESTTNGILYNSNKTGLKVTGNLSLIATADTGIGIDASGATDATIDGVESSGYATHITAQFSTNCAITNNLARGGGTNVSAPSATGLTAVNNNTVL